MFIDSDKLQVSNKPNIVSIDELTKKFPIVALYIHYPSLNLKGVYGLKKNGNIHGKILPEKKGNIILKLHL